MAQHRFLISILLILFNSAPVFANEVAFTNLTSDQANQIIKEFSANFTHTSVSGASSLGDIFGFEVGLVAGITKTDEIDKLVKAADAGADVDRLAHGGLLVMASVPFGVTFEGSFIPSVGKDDFKFKNMGLGLKWTLNSVVELPVSLAMKAHFMKTSLEFKQTVSNVTSQVAFDDKVAGLLFLVSKDLEIVEPYAGVGFLRGDGQFDVSGSTQFFQSGVTSYSSTEKGTQLILGIEANLLFFKLGAEVSRTFGANGVTLKLAGSF